MSLDPETILALVGGTGAGAVVDRLAGRLLNRRRETVDVAQASVETAALMLAELRAELAGTRASIAAADAKIETLSEALTRAHIEIGELRVALSSARAEIAELRRERTQ